MKNIRPRVLVLASGGESSDDGGSGARELYEYSQVDHPGISYEIIGVVSNRKQGGVWKKMNDLKAGHLFEYAAGPFDEQFYLSMIEKYQPDIIMLSGWLKRVVGPVLDIMKGKIINIHPALLPLTAGLYGHLAHEKVIEAFQDEKIKFTEFVIHFVDDSWDNESLAIMRHRVLLRNDDNADSIAARVNEKERAWQAYVLSLVANKCIYLNNRGVVQFDCDFLRQKLLP